jgi:ubiquinone/menaquinone biosynthesis C-methylase UbiE
MDSIQGQERNFLPAAGHDWLLPLYDPFVKLAGGNAIRKRLIQLVDIQPGHAVLEIGCGTGSVVIEVKRSQPAAQVTGLDPDLKALERAKRKANRKKMTIRFDQGFSDQLPYPDQSFDRVLSSFMFHHLNDQEKEKTLEEAQRVLKPGGSFYLVDFEKHESGGMLARLFHSHERLKDNSVSRILTLFSKAGFADPKLIDKGRLLFLDVAYFGTTTQRR